MLSSFQFLSPNETISQSVSGQDQAKQTLNIWFIFFLPATLHELYRKSRHVFKYSDQVSSGVLLLEECLMGKFPLSQ